MALNTGGTLLLALLLLFILLLAFFAFISDGFAGVAKLVGLFDDVIRNTPDGFTGAVAGVVIGRGFVVWVADAGAGRGFVVWPGGVEEMGLRTGFINTPGVGDVDTGGGGLVVVCPFVAGVGAGMVGVFVIVVEGDVDNGGLGSCLAL